MRMGWKSKAALILVAVLAVFGWRWTVDRLGTFNFLLPKDADSRRVAADVAYAAGARHALDIYAPLTVKKNRPVIVFFYGGSWDSGYRQGYEFVGRALAAQGFVVVVPDYRLVPNAQYPDFLRDCADAVRWTHAHIAEYGGDGGKIVLAGHSAGAYNAAEIALDPQWLGADLAEVKGVVGLAGPYDFLPIDGPATRAAFGAWPRLAETQPINHVHKGAPPMLLLHGENDTLVSPKKSVTLAARLTAAGSRALTKFYPQVDHYDIITAFAWPLRTKAPVLIDAARFAHDVTSAAE